MRLFTGMRGHVVVQHALRRERFPTYLASEGFLPRVGEHVVPEAALADEAASTRRTDVVWRSEFQVSFLVLLTVVFPRKLFTAHLAGKHHTPRVNHGVFVERVFTLEAFPAGLTHERPAVGVGDHVVLQARLVSEKPAAHGAGVLSRPDFPRVKFLMFVERELKFIGFPACVAGVEFPFVVTHLVFVQLGPAVPFHATRVTFVLVWWRDGSFWV